MIIFAISEKRLEGVMIKMVDFLSYFLNTEKDSVRSERVGIKHQSWILNKE